MSTKISQFMGGLGIDTRDVLGAAANSTVTIGDGSTTGTLFVGNGTTTRGLTSNGATFMGQVEGNYNRVRIVTYTPTNSVYNQIGDGTFNTGGDYHFARYLSADNIAVTMNTITYSMSVTGNLAVGTNSSNTVAITGALDVTGELDVTGGITGDGLTIDGTFDLGTL